MLKYRRRTTYKRKSRRKFYKKKLYKRKITRQVHWFKRRATALPIIGNGVTNNQFIGLNFTLSSVINAGEFSALFDQYKITGISLKFYLTRNTANASLVNGALPRLYIVTDYDTSTTPVSFDELREYSNCKVWNFTSRPYSYFFRPKILNEVYRTAVSTGTSPIRPPWVSTSHLDLQHFGVRLGLENILDPDIAIVVEPTFYFGCKNVK